MLPVMRHDTIIKGEIVYFGQLIHYMWGHFLDAFVRYGIVTRCLTLLDSAELIKDGFRG